MRFSKKQVRIICIVIAGIMVVSVGLGIIGSLTSVL